MKISIADIVKNAARFALKGCSVECETYMPEDCLPTQVNEGQISEAVHRLLVNAENANPEGGVIKVCVESINCDGKGRVTLAERRYIRISVEDRDMAVVLAY